MFLRLLFESFRRQKRRKSVALLAIALGMSIATAMIAVGNDIGDKINQELRSLGANLVVTPIEDTLDVNIGGVNLKPASEGAFINEQTSSRSASSGTQNQRLCASVFTPRKSRHERAGRD
jgi:putative ABC transport system permease protein